MKLEYINIYYYTNIPVYISIQGVSTRVGIKQVKLTPWISIKFFSITHFIIIIIYQIRFLRKISFDEAKKEYLF